MEVFGEEQSWYFFRFSPVGISSSYF
jgi:hypothetical protein